MLWYQTIPRWFQRLFPYFEWRVPVEEKKVYLTFDDGPHPEITPWVMDQLERHGMKGTFFCVGDNVKKFPEVAKELLERGHKIGNHTMHHIKGWSTPNDAYLKDVEECSELMDTNLFRPPYGRIRGSQAKVLRRRYRIIMWDLLSCDFEKKLDIENALKGLKTKTRSGSIVVFHDSMKAEKNLKAMLPGYLEYLSQNGYTCTYL